MGYALPTATDWVTASWQTHKDRSPPSSEPGTDYGIAYGQPACAVEAGQVTYIKTTNSQAMGRVVEYRLDDGRTTRCLHLSAVWVNVGQRVTRGQQLGVSGASGNGSDWWYGPHLHQTLWPGEAWAAPTIDFDLYVDQEDPMPTADEIAKAVWNYKVQPQDENGNYIPGSYPARGFLSNTSANAQAAKRYAQQPITPEQVQQIADQIAAQLVVPPAEVDYEAIAQAVNDEAAARLVE